MKIALFIADFSLGGAERVFATLARGINSRGHQVDLLIGNTNGAVNLDLVPKQVRVIDLKVKRTRNSLPLLIGYLKRHKPEVMLSTRIESCCFALLAKILSGVKTSIILREANTVSYDLKKYTFKKRLVLGLFMRFLYPFADMTICVSNGVKKDLLKFLQLNENKLSVIYSPIITEDLVAEASQDCSHPWFKDHNIPIIIGMGRLTEQKRFDILIKAFAAVRKEKKARLLIIGDGEERNKLQSLIVNLGLQNDICLLGFDPNPFKFLSRATLFVLSSDWEGLPGALIQALACGCPVISTDCPSGPREILKGGKLGRLIPVGDVEKMASAIKETLQTLPTIVKLEELREFTENYSINEYLNLFKAVRKQKHDAS